ncbi:MAG: response regulator [Treponema sp.]|nr:response regulator [Treponema sp.]
MGLKSKGESPSPSPDWDLAGVEELNFRVFRTLAMVSVLAGIVLCAGTLIPGTYLSTPDFRILFLASTVVFTIYFLISRLSAAFVLRHSIPFLYMIILTCQVFFLVLDRIVSSHRGSEAPYTIILGFLMAQPIIITDKTSRLSAWTTASVLECIILSILLKPPMIAMNDVINCAVLGIIGIKIGRVSKSYFMSYTEMKVKEKDVEIMAAEAASKAKSEFLALISHEVRTPLNAVTNMNEMILRESTDQTALGYAKSIKHACRTLSALINDILDFSKLNSGEFTLLPIEYKLDGMLDDVLNMIMPRAREKGLDFTVNVQEDIPNNLIGDDIRIKQCLANLLSNAVKYTDSGGVTLSVSWQQAEADDDQSIFISFSVSDTGIGIKSEDFSKIAYPFERLDELKNRSIEGTGLGLAIVRGILKKMGSFLKVKSEYGKGSEFSFTIWQPVTVAIPIGKYTPRTSSNDGARASRYGTFTAPDARILIVDDMQANLDVMCSLLKCTKIRVDTATRGKDAVDMVARTHYDVIFIDHRMPGMDGIETLHEIWLLGAPREDGSIPGMDGVKFIALTANAAKDSRQNYIREGFNDYLAKPVDPQELEEMLVRHLPKKLVMLSAGKTGGEHTDRSKADDAFLQEYAKLEESDTGTAMRYCGSVESLRKTAESFCAEAGANAEKLMRVLTEKDLKLCGITAHTLKTALRLLGFTSLSLTAAQLEEYADSEYEEGLRILVPDFAGEIIRYGERLGGILGAKAATKRTPMDDGQRHQAIKALAECAESGDLRTAGHILDMLAEYEIPEDFSETFRQAGQAVRNKDREFFRELTADLKRTEKKKEEFAL